MHTFKKQLVCLLLLSLVCSPFSQLAFASDKRSGERDKARVHDSLKEYRKKDHRSHQHKSGASQFDRPQRKPAIPGGRQDTRPGLPLRHQTLLLLLAEKYSPETLADWQKTVDEGDKLRADIQSVVRNNPRLRKSLRMQHTEDLRARFEQNMQVRKAIQDALRVGDVAAIRANLAVILVRLKERNTLLATKLAELRR